jgi:hypothetical protein
MFMGWLSTMCPRKKRQTLETFGISLNQAASGILATGQIGAGKTSLISILARSILEQGVGCCWCGVKPDETQHAIDIITKAGRAKDLVVFGPGHGYSFNPLAYVLGQPGGTPEMFAAHLTRWNANLQRLHSASTSEEGFWAALHSQAGNLAVSAAWLAWGSAATLETVAKVVAGAPASLEDARSASFKSSFAYEILRGAEINAGESSEKHRATQAIEFFTNRLPSIGDKGFGAVSAYASAILSPFTLPPLRDLCCTEESTITPDDVLNGACVVLDMPALVWGQMGVLFQLVFAGLCQDACLRRVITPHSLPVLSVKDEYQLLCDASYDVLAQTVSRSQKWISLAAFQTIPVLLAALGGRDKAQAEVDALVACHGTKYIMANNCEKTNEWAANLMGHSKKSFMSLHQQGEQKQGFFKDVMGVGGGMNFSMNQQWHYNVPPHAFEYLRKGGPDNNFLIDCFVHQGGRRFAPHGRCYQKLTFQQEL